jgi:hypothetical protein
MFKNFSKEVIFLSTISLLVIFRLVIFYGILPHVRYSPFDDNLYVNRALSLLNGNFFGDFNPYTLAKLPGISFWLYFSRILQIPYMLGINLLYIFSGIYLIWALKERVAISVLVLIFVLYLINPITFSSGWFFLMREPLSSILTVLIIGSSLHIFRSSSFKIACIHNLIFTLCITFLFFLREEDKLILVYLIGFAILRLRLNNTSLKAILCNLFVSFLIPITLIICCNHLVRSEIQNHYGLPIINDFSEGEFPKMVAAIRSVHSEVDNRFVMMPQDVMKLLSHKIPEISDIFSKMPAPGLNTYSCKLTGVCREWANGWMPWFFKQAAYDSGYTNSLVTSQNFFRGIRERIETMCINKELICVRKGDGFFPPMDLRWSRAYLLEFKSLISMLLIPKLDFVKSNENALNASGDIIKVYSTVLMMPVLLTARELSEESRLSLLRELLGMSGGVISFLIIISGLAMLIWRLVMYPIIKLDPIYYVLVLFLIYSILRIIALSYVAVFLGPYESRIIFSTYTGLLLICPLFIWECIQARISYNLFLKGK